MSGCNAGNPRPLPPLDVLRAALRIDPDSPSGLAWVGPAQGRRVGGVAGRRTSTGHWDVGVGSSRFGVHRIIWALATGSDPGEFDIDHIDGDPSNNRVANLRTCSRSQNLRNGRAGASGALFKGAYPSGARWRSILRVGGRLLHLGMFCSARDAAAAYNRAVFAECGPFARLNDLDNPGETLSATEITTDEMRARVGLPLEGEQ
jgi:hypothetical protein